VCDSFPAARQRLLLHNMSTGVQRSLAKKLTSTSFFCCWGFPPLCVAVQFDTSQLAALLTTVVMLLSLCAMAFFHRKWTSHILDKEQIELVGVEYHEVQLLMGWSTVCGGVLCVSVCV
jgi:hypothetical protein